MRPAELKTVFYAKENMASYHVSIKTISRSEGRSATGAAAYRAGVEIIEERTGESHDYTRKGGVESAAIYLPDDAPEWAYDRSKLWNAVEAAETRKNSTVAREFEVALPSELPAEERRQLAHDFAKEIVARHGCAVDVAIHAPGKGDDRNHHAHILCSTRRLTAEGFTEKTRELDDRKSGEVVRWRERFATLQNERLAKNGIEERVDHRSLKAQGIDREPTRHLGPTATAIERRTGEPSRKREDFERLAAERLSSAKELGQMEREAKQLESSIILLSADIAKAKAERDELRQKEAERPARGFGGAFSGAIAEAGLKAPEKPVGPVLRQEKTLSLKPGETAEMAAERLRKGYFEEARNQWRDGEAGQHAEKVVMYRKEVQTLRGLEPKKPLLFGVKDWERDHFDWAKKIREADRLATHHEFRGKSVLKGELDHDSGQIQSWQKLAQKRLEIEHPQLNQAAIEEREKRQVEQARAKEWAAADRAIKTFKDHAEDRENRAYGFENGGENWQATPPGIREMIDGYNKLPLEARPVVLERMRENFKNDPQGAQRLVQQVENANDRGPQWER